MKTALFASILWIFTVASLSASSIRDLPSPITSITLTSGTFEMDGTVSPTGQGLGVGADFAGGSANLSANCIFLNAPFGSEAYYMGYESAFGHPRFTMNSTAYNSSTGVFSGTFTAEEFVRLPGHKEAFAVYLVSGSFVDTLDLASLTACGGDGDFCGTVGQGQISIGSSQYLGMVTPEPSTWVMMALGVLGIAGLVWRKRLVAA